MYLFAHSLTHPPNRDREFDPTVAATQPGTVAARAVASSTTDPLAYDLHHQLHISSSAGTGAGTNDDDEYGPSDAAHLVYPVAPEHPPIHPQVAADENGFLRPHIHDFYYQPGPLEAVCRAVKKMSVSWFPFHHSLATFVTFILSIYLSMYLLASSPYPPSQYAI